MEEKQISHSLIILLLMSYTYLPSETCRTSTVYKLLPINESVSRQRVKLENLNDLLIMYHNSKSVKYTVSFSSFTLTSI